MRANATTTQRLSRARQKTFSEARRLVALADRAYKAGMYAEALKLGERARRLRLAVDKSGSLAGPLGPLPNPQRYQVYYIDEPGGYYPHHKLIKPYVIYETNDLELARANKATNERAAKRAGTPGRFEIRERGQVINPAEPMPFFCSICDSELKQGDAKELADRRWVCGRCAKQLEHAKQDRAQGGLFEPEQFGLFENPERRVNVEGFKDKAGRFHPIRADKEKYNEFAAGDFDSYAEKKKKREAAKAEDYDQQMRDYYAKSKAKLAKTFRRKHKSLSQFVRGAGGIGYKAKSKQGRGDLKSKRGGATMLGMLSSSQTGSTGLLNQKSKQGVHLMSAGRMMDAAHVEGYRDRNGERWQHVEDFLADVAEDATAGGRKFYTQADLTEQGEAEAEINPVKWIDGALTTFSRLPVGAFFRFEHGKTVSQKLGGNRYGTQRANVYVRETMFPEDGDPPVVQLKHGGHRHNPARGRDGLYLVKQTIWLDQVNTFSEWKPVKAPNKEAAKQQVEEDLLIHGKEQAPRYKIGEVKAVSATVFNRAVERRRNPLPVDEWDDIDEEEAFELGGRARAAADKAVRERLKARTRYWQVSYYSPMRGRRVEFIRPIAADKASDAKAEAKAMVTNEPKAINFVAREVQRNPKGQGPRSAFSRDRFFAGMIQAGFTANEALKAYNWLESNYTREFLRGIKPVQFAKDNEYLWRTSHFQHDVNPAKPRQTLTAKEQAQAIRNYAGRMGYYVRTVRDITSLRRKAIIEWLEKRNDPRLVNYKQNPSRGLDDYQRKHLQAWLTDHVAASERRETRANIMAAIKDDYSLIDPAQPDHNRSWREIARLGEVTRSNPGSERDPITSKQAREIIAEAKDYLLRTWPGTETENHAFRHLASAYEFAGFNADRAFEAAQRELNKKRSKRNPGLVDLAAGVQAADYLSKRVLGKRRNPLDKATRIEAAREYFNRYRDTRNHAHLAHEISALYQLTNAEGRKIVAEETENLFEKIGRQTRKRSNPRPPGYKSPYDLNVDRLEKVIREVIREDKRRGTVGSSDVNLRMMVGTRATRAGVDLPNLYSFNQAFAQALERVRPTLRGYKVFPHGYRENPSVKSLSKMFQGKANGAVHEYKAASNAPADLARIGQLVFLKLAGNRKQTRVPGAMVAVDSKGKLWLCSNRAPMFKQKAKPGEALDFGEIDRICYQTTKAHLGDRSPVEYVHTFGEEGGKRPRLLVDHEGMGLLRGGDYQIKAEGIVN